jgi:hypothetical protein
LLVQCRLRPKEPVNQPIKVDEVQQLANKMAQMQREQQRPVAGWLVGNTGTAEPDALALAQAEGIVLQQAHLPPKWQDKVDWQISKLTPIV